MAPSWCDRTLLSLRAQPSNVDGVAHDQLHEVLQKVCCSGRLLGCWRPSLYYQFFSCFLNGSALDYCQAKVMLQFCTHWLLCCSHDPSASVTLAENCHWNRTSTSTDFPLQTCTTRYHRRVLVRFQVCTCALNSHWRAEHTESTQPHHHLLRLEKSQCQITLSPNN